MPHTVAPTLRIQPDGITCGPAVAAMVADCLLKRRGGVLRLGIQDIRRLCGTDGITGTTHDRMATALAAFGIKYKRRSGGCDADALASISAAVEAGDMAILRTTTNGVFHWVLAHGSEGELFDVCDPWLGDIRLTPRKLSGLIRPRNNEYWLVPGDQEAADIQFGPLAEMGSGEAAKMRSLDMVQDAFAPFVGGDPGWIRPYAEAATDWELSWGVLVNGRIEAVYLLKETSLEDIVADHPAGEPFSGDIRAFSGQSGVQGVALVVSPGMRGRGYGRLLRSVPGAMGYDYVFGLQMKALGNLEQWLEHRTLVAQNSGCWVTAAHLDGYDIRRSAGIERGGPRI